MKAKRQIAVLCILLVIISVLTGCSGKDKKTTAASGTAKEGEVPMLKWVAVGTEQPANYEKWQKELNAYLEEKIGVNVDIEVVSYGNWENRHNMIDNSGEYFDILFTDKDRYMAEVHGGLLLDISEMVKKNTPDLYKMIPENIWKAASFEDKIYAVPTYKDSARTLYFIWDNAVAKKYDIDITKANTLETAYEALKKIKDGEGGSPWLMDKAGADFILHNYDPLGTGLDCLGVRYDDGSKKVVNPLEEKEVLDKVKIIRKAYQENIINSDAPTFKGDPYRVFFVSSGWSGAARSVWGPNYGVEDCQAVQFEEGVLSNNTVCGSLNAIAAASKYPEKALELLQLVNTDTKVRDMLYYGLEGEDFEYTEDKKVHRINTDWKMAQYTQGSFFQVTPVDTEPVNPFDEVKELNDKAKTSVMVGFNMDTSNLMTELAQCRSVYEKYKAEFWTGAGDTEELLSKLKEELKAAGWDKIRDEAQKQVDAFK